MPTLTSIALQPRKSPVQARSTASVDAILEATVQVLLAVGKERLTTTRVATRAGVSVGTLYQYFPNKSALLQAALRRHFDQVREAIETTCLARRGASLTEMATALATAYMQAKMHDPQTSVALYAVSSDVDGIKMAKQVGLETHRAITAMLASANQPLVKDARLVASAMQGAMAGISRRLLESEDPVQLHGVLREELIAMLCGYLERCSR